MKFDSQFKEPIQGRSLGSKIYNGPGKNHDVLGKVQKDGIVLILGRTQDRAWLNIRCGENTDGWVLSSDVDFNCERKFYKHYDTI